MRRGMTVVDKKAASDVESELEPGDVVFYDGLLQHGVQKIVPFEAGGVGRLSHIFRFPRGLARSATIFLRYRGSLQACPWQMALV